MNVKEYCKALVRTNGQAKALVIATNSTVATTPNEHTPPEVLKLHRWWQNVQGAVRKMK